MPERPLLILPSPGEPLPRQKGPPNVRKTHFPSSERQAERMSSKFESMLQAIEERKIQLKTEAHGLVPEEVIVLETVETVDEFINAVRRIPGMELLAEVETEDIPPDDDFFAVTGAGEPRRDRTLEGRAFLVFTDQSALRKIYGHWQTWLSKQQLEYGLGKLENLFKQLYDVRFWGVKDRLQETGILDDWRERVKFGQDLVPCEIELWYRRNQAQRHAARDRVVHLVEDMGGQIIAEAEIEEISYHALSAHLPVDQVRPLFDSGKFDIALVQCEQIQYFRACGQMSASLADDVQELDDEALSDEPPTGFPVVALFDGLPLQRHHLLQGRLVIDDPDGFEQDYPVATRRHGTAMASLILHGDLAAGEEPSQRPLYVRPIMKQNPRDWINHVEMVPEGTLVADLIHRAVRRLFEPDGGEAPVAPHVSIINLSIGIRDRPFDRSMSPLARLLDWLAWRYRILFIVSAGNHAREIELAPLPQPKQSLLFCMQEQVIRAIAADTRHRRLLSPAETVNALTVASIHADASTGQPPPGQSDPYVDAGLPSPFNAQGMGYRRGIKPDLLAAGGRTMVQKPPTGEATFEICDGGLSPGQLVATPSPAVGDQKATRHMRGTSNATALVSRACGFLYDVIDDLRRGPRGETINDVSRAVWIKALVAHGANWSEAGSILTAILKDKSNSKKFKEYVTRLLGYGAVDVDRVKECTSQRVTALGGGELGKDETHIHNFPLPQSLSGWNGHCRLTITLAWLSPVNPQHQAWRRAALWFDLSKDPLQLKRQQADWRAVRRGTLQHEIFEGKNAGVFDVDGTIEVRVSCREGAGILEDKVPYALATTLEVAEQLNVDIYSEVRDAIHAIGVRLNTT